MRMFRIEESETYKMIIEKGIEKGAKEEKISIAKKLLKEGMNIDRIAEITELPKEEIKKLMN
jgi:predicted transposase/invertase (TIGR01784 family)